MLMSVARDALRTLNTGYGCDYSRHAKQKWKMPNCVRKCKCQANQEQKNSDDAQTEVECCDCARRSVGSRSSSLPCGVCVRFQCALNAQIVCVYLRTRNQQKTKLNMRWHSSSHRRTKMWLLLLLLLIMMMELDDRNKNCNLWCSMIAVKWLAHCDSASRSYRYFVCVQ